MGFEFVVPGWDRLLERGKEFNDQLLAVFGQCTLDSLWKNNRSGSIWQVISADYSYSNDVDKDETSFPDIFEVKIASENDRYKWINLKELKAKYTFIND